MQGTLQRNGDSVRITFSVWNAQQQSQIAGDTLDGAASDIFGIEDRLADDVIASLKLTSAPSTHLQATGLDTAAEQEQYIKAIGSLQRYDKDSAVDEAIQILTALARERPSAPLVQAALGRAYLNKFRLTRDSKWVEYASSACTRARQLSPDFAEVDVTLGELRTASGQAKDAIAAFQRALSAQPNNFGALLGLGDALNVTGNLREAEATYKRAIDLQPSYWGGYSKLAGFYFLHAQYAQAAETFRRVTELSPDNARAFGNLGAAYQLMGDFERALAAYRKSLALAPTAMAYSNVGTLEFFSGHPKAAADAYEAALRLNPNHFLFWANLGDAYRWTPGLESKAADTYAKAISLCRGELRLNAEQGLVHSVLALSLAKTGKVTEAEEQAQKALSLDPGNPELLYNAAVVANISHKHREALAWILLASRKGYPKAFIAREPEFENLRGDPVFKEAVQSQQ
jgi:serine/threonine-protein kinase